MGVIDRALATAPIRAEGRRESDIPAECVKGTSVRGLACGFTLEGWTGSFGYLSGM